MVSFSACSTGVCAARVAFKDIREEFAVSYRVSNEDLCDLATIRGVNHKTLSEIANRLFEAGQAKVIELFHVVNISREDLAARRNDFAWGKSPFPRVMGIVEPNPQEMPASEFKERKERDIVDRMLRLLGYSGFSISNPNEKQPNTKQKPETGADVVAKLDGRVIAFQVTEYHFDVTAETKGSSSRREESRKADLGLPAVTWVEPFSISAVIHRIREKATKGWSQKDFPDMRLLVAASIPQHGGTASTFVLPPRIDVDDLNVQVAPILEQTKYSAAYLYVMISESVYKWTRESGWKKL
jgi:hypothetical protein